MEKSFKINQEKIKTNKNSTLIQKSQYSKLVQEKKYYILPNYNDEQWQQDIQPILQNIKQKQYKTMEQIVEVLMNFIKLQLEEVNDIYAKNIKIYLNRFNSTKSKEFINELFPYIGELALQVKQIFPKKIPLLQQNIPQTVQLTKQQVGCLLAHMFLCTTVKQKDNELLPILNNFSFFYGERYDTSLEKIKLLLNYFSRIKDLDKDHLELKIQYTRLLKDTKTYTYKFWLAQSNAMSKIIIRKNTKIEEAENSVWVDFANKFIGGGVLQAGCVQEEILFMICPEYLVSVLLSERMNDNEAIYIRGAEQYSQYQGYSKRFQFAGDFQDQNILKYNSDLIAIDAFNFRIQDKNNQYSDANIIRELNKAYIGFDCQQNNSKQKKMISTGNWGCGALYGNPQLKFIIQWIAASLAQVTLLYNTFQDEQLVLVEDVINKLNNLDIGQVFGILMEYCKNLKIKQSQKIKLFDHILNYEL